MGLAQAAGRTFTVVEIVVDDQRGTPPEMSRPTKVQEERGRRVVAPATKVYLAAPYQEREHMLVWRAELQRRGLRCTSRWILNHEPATGTEALRRYAIEDLCDVAEADFVILFNSEVWHEFGTGGRHVETGFALAHGKPVIIVGRPSNVFHHVDAVTCLPTLGHAIAYIKSIVKEVASAR